MDLSGSTMNPTLYEFYQFISEQTQINNVYPNELNINDEGDTLMTRSNAEIMLEMENAINRVISAVDLHQQTRRHSRISALLSNSLFDDTSSYKNILSEDGETEQLQYIEYTPETCRNSSCPITQTDFAVNQQIIKLPCNHCFEPDEIKQWVKEESAECPVCRFALKSVEKKKDEHLENNTNTHDSDSRRLRHRHTIETMLFREQEAAEENDIQQAILASLAI
jgi:hypothetical protein